MPRIGDPGPTPPKAKIYLSIDDNAVCISAYPLPDTNEPDQANDLFEKYNMRVRCLMPFRRAFDSPQTAINILRNILVEAGAIVILE